MPDLSTWDVIVVDDEPDNIGVIELVLGYHQARVRTASSGRECLLMIEKQVPNLFLVDIQMPEMSGFELLARLRTNPVCGHLPVIAITAHAMSGDEERILAAGFDGYIPKPVSAMTLADELMTIVEAKVKRESHG